MSIPLPAAAIWTTLADVVDPEIPVVSLVEMGIIRGVEVDDTAVTVTITPTFSGCPALHVMKGDILAKLTEIGVDQGRVEIVLHPPWSSDWISDDGRRKLKSFGLSPPARHGGNLAVVFFEPVACPYCNSPRTSVKNEFGPTLCRAIYYCHHCEQPFEQFKPL